MGEQSKKMKEVRGAKLGLGQLGNGRLQAVQQKGLLGSRTHRPAVTLTFTLMGEWQVRGNEIWEGRRRRKSKAAWSVSPGRRLSLSFRGQPGTSQSRKAAVFCDACGPACWHASLSSAPFPSGALCLWGQGQEEGRGLLGSAGPPLPAPEGRAEMSESMQ